MSRWCIILVLLALPAAGLLPALAENTSEPVAKAPAKVARTELPAFTKEREAAALTFVRTHHGELGDLLVRLKQHNRMEYEKAIRELFRASERLAQMQEKNPARYETDLQHWKLNSRIQILAARLAMADDPAVRRELREVLAEQAELKRQQLQAERDRMAFRLEEINRELQKDMAVSVEERLEQLVQGTRERSRQRDASKRPAKDAAGDTKNK